MLGPRDLALVRRMRRNGIINPVWTLLAARAAKLPLALACALLEQESGGGHNVFGHDPTIFAGAGRVTKAKYLAYKKARGPHGRGGMQGAGPCQLTWYSIQDEADRLGGCWKPRWNMQVGFSRLAALVRRYGMRAGLAAYNGSGPAARRYALSVERRAEKWRFLLAPPKADSGLKKARALLALCRKFDSGYYYGGEHDGTVKDDSPHGHLDCSSSTSYVLYCFGLLPVSRAQVSAWFEHYGDPGRGRYVTIHANAEHVWIEFTLPEGYFRFDTSPHGCGARGPRVRTCRRSDDGFVHRHPRGL